MARKSRTIERSESQRIPRTKTLNVGSGSEDEDEAQDESASVPCRPDTPPPKTHRQIKTLSPKRKSIDDRSGETRNSSVKDEARRSAIPKALKKRLGEASEADKSRRSLTEVRSRRHSNANGLSRRGESVVTVDLDKKAESQLLSSDSDGKDSDEEDNELTVRNISSPTDETTDGTATFSVRENLPKLQLTDHELGPLIKCRLESGRKPDIEVSAESEITKRLLYQWERLEVRNGLVYRRKEGKPGEIDILQLLTPRQIVNDALKASHEGQTGGHFSIKRTLDQVRRRFYWPSWKADTVRFCHECERCNEYHQGKLIRERTSQPVVLGALYERWYIDRSIHSSRSSTTVRQRLRHSLPSFRTARRSTGGHRKSSSFSYADPLKKKPARFFGIIVAKRLIKRKYAGTFLVVATPSSVTVRLQGRRTAKSFTVHVDKPYRGVVPVAAVTSAM